MIGDAAPPAARGARATPGDVVATVDHLTLMDARGAVAVRDASVSIRAGEILGIAGVEGSGQRELLRALAGRIGTRGESVRAPREVGFVPADRHRDAVVLEFSLAENVALHGAGAARGRMRWSAIRQRTDRLVRAFDVRGGSAKTSVRALSGGNQQKLVLARELESKAKLLVAENPTRGLDIRAAAAVHDALRRAAEEGAAVVVYSSDLDEVLSLATRMVVMHAASVRDVAMDRAAVARAMLGSA
jgi:simple sugar transport system ATP-binding protein